MVRQELYGLFITHYAIRAFMIEAADTVDIDPDRISFTRTLHIIRRRITDSRNFPPTARKALHKRDIRETIERQNRRRPRSYPAPPKPETGTTSQPRHPNIVSNTTDHTYSSRSQRPPN
jgi:hypothetical protein